jgi:hypothetical protein
VITLLAYDPGDLYAFVRDGEAVVHVRPPYDVDHPASTASVERAVTVHGFTALERDFDSREELLSFLGEESARWWRENASGGDLDLGSLRERLLSMRERIRDNSRRRNHLSVVRGRT